MRVDVVVIDIRDYLRHNFAALVSSQERWQNLEQATAQDAVFQSNGDATSQASCKENLRRIATDVATSIIETYLNRIAQI